MSPPPETPAAAPPAAAPVGEVPAGAAGEWVTARPPRLLEVVQRVVLLPGRFHRHRDLVSSSVRRSLEARFKGTILGWAWPLVHPLFLFAVYYFVFTELLQVKMPGLPEDKKAGMGVFMFVGIMAWSVMSESLNTGTNVIVDNGNLIKKLAFPSELLPLNIVLTGLVTQLFAIGMFLLACLLTPMWPIQGVELLWIPVLLFLQGLFTYGLILFLSTVQVFLRDTLQLVGIITTIWMFLTPLFWAPALMNSEVENYLPLIEANPVYHLVQAWRVSLMGGIYIEPDGVARLGGYVVAPDGIVTHLWIFALWALGAYVVGYTLFILAQRRFADEV